MVKEDLINRSPVRLLEKKAGGGLAAGELGVIAALTGIGKTSVLVQIALDKLLQGKKIIHISFNQHSDYVLNWYEHIFDEFTKKKNLQNERDIKEDLVKNRIVMNFNQEGVTSDVIRSSLKAMIVDGGYKAEAIIIDGFDFAIASRERIATLKSFAKELGFCVWYSYSPVGDNIWDKRRIPVALKDVEDLFDAIIALEAKPTYTELNISKNRGVYGGSDSILKLDPKSLLILE
jgi:hypothetical protein